MRLNYVCNLLWSLQSLVSSIYLFFSLGFDKFNKPWRLPSLPTVVNARNTEYTKSIIFLESQVIQSLFLFKMSWFKLREIYRWPFFSGCVWMFYGVCVDLRQNPHCAQLLPSSVCTWANMRKQVGKYSWKSNIRVRTQQQKAKNQKTGNDINYNSIILDWMISAQLSRTNVNNASYSDLTSCTRVELHW